MSGFRLGIWLVSFLRKGVDGGGADEGRSSHPQNDKREPDGFVSVLVDIIYTANSCPINLALWPVFRAGM